MTVSVNNKGDRCQGIAQASINLESALIEALLISVDKEKTWLVISRGGFVVCFKRRGPPMREMCKLGNCALP